jgi:hypothetical protein
MLDCLDGAAPHLAQRLSLVDVIVNANGVSGPDETLMVTGDDGELVKLMPVGA